MHCDSCHEKVYQLVPGQPTLFKLTKPDGTTIAVCYKCKEKLQYLYRLQRALAIVANDDVTIDRLARALYYHSYSAAGYVGNMSWDALPEEADMSKDPPPMAAMGKRMWRRKIREMLLEAGA